MKKILVWLLAAIMVFSFAACNTSTVSQDEVENATPAPATATPEASEEPEATPVPDYTNEIIFGSTTESMGDFYDGWTNSAIDAYAKEWLAGYSTVSWTQEGVFAIDEKVTVKEHTIAENEDGTKTFTFTINDNLLYNNGDAITAADYVAYVLLYASPQFAELENVTTVGSKYVGYDDYYAGKTTTFTGVRLIDEYTFSVTVKAEELPYHYDLAIVGIPPMPVGVLAPSAVISDNGEGVTIEGLDIEELRVSLLDPATGFRYNPSVTSGAYQFVSFDKETRSYVLQKNPNYLGNYAGTIPSIERIVVKLVEEPTMMDELATGSVDILTGLSGGVQINAGLDLVDQGIAEKANYPRYGYGKIAFHCDFGPTQFPAVRQAIAHALDRNEFIRQQSGGFAVIVNGYYGASMREYVENKDVLDAELNQYAYSLDEAKRLLVEDGWVLNAKGEEFVEGTDEVRYKDVDGELMPLIIKWSSSGNSVAQTLNTLLIGEAAKIGMKIEETVMDFSLLLKNNYRDGLDTPEYHMYNLGIGFNNQQAYWYYYSTKPEHMGQYNTNFIVDEELETLANEMKLIPAEDTETWNATWMKFQKRWNYLLPDIPLYSDDYHDVFNKKLENYSPDSQWDIRYAILSANIVGFGE